MLSIMMLLGALSKSLRKYTKADIRITPTMTSKAFETGMETIYFSTSTLSRHLTNYVH